MPKDNIIYSYVITDSNDNVTDFCSFFLITNDVLNNDKHKNLKIAYSYYNVSTTQSMDNLIKESLILAKNNNFDIYNILNLMDNNEFLDKLKFKITNGNLKYYLYNFNLNKIKSNENAIILF